MMKLRKSLGLATLTLLAFVASESWAGNFTTIPLKVASEKLTEDYSKEANRIDYTPSTDLPSGTILYMKSTGAVWKACVDESKIYLLDKDGNQKGSLDACVDENGNEDNHWLKIIIGDDVAAGTVLTLSENSDAVDNIDFESFEIKQGETGSVNVEAVKANISGNDIVGAKAGPSSVFNIVNQFDFKVTQLGEATIDVEDENAPRKVFVGGSTTSIASVALIDNGAELDDAITLDANDKLSLTLNFETTPDYIAKVCYDLNDNGDCDDGEELNVDPEAKQASNEFDAVDANGNLNNHDIIVKVTGEDVLSPQTITLDAKLSLADENYVREWSGLTAFEWSINGAQLKVPYLYNSSSTFVRITNEADTDAEVSVDVIDESGNKASQVSLGTVPAHGAILIKADQMVSKAKEAGWTPDNTGRFTATFIVTASPDKVSAVAIQKIPGGVDRVIPVLTPEELEVTVDGTVTGNVTGTANATIQGNVVGDFDGDDENETATIENGAASANVSGQLNGNVKAKFTIKGKYWK
jgi:hypothetical protein